MGGFLIVNGDGATTEHEVRKVQILDDDLYVLHVERGGLEFLPGDCVALFDGAGESRPYSIASGNGEDTLRFLIRKLEEGEVSSWLMARQPGDRVRVSPPFGWFRPGQDIGDAPFVFVATGTGVAPFLSYHHSFAARPPQQILYGIRQRCYAIGFDEIAGWCPVRLAISREATEAHHEGRVTDLLEGVPVDPETHFYLCGHESMIREATDWLQARGVDLLNIHREVFFHE